jgi:hypothetical protein
MSLYYENIIKCPRRFYPTLTCRQPWRRDFSEPDTMLLPLQETPRSKFSRIPNYLKLRLDSVGFS